MVLDWLSRPLSDLWGLQGLLLFRPLWGAIAVKHPLHDAGGYWVDASRGLAILAHLPFADGLGEGVEDDAELGLGEAKTPPGLFELVRGHYQSEASNVFAIAKALSFGSRRVSVTGQFYP